MFPFTLRVMGIAIIAIALVHVVFGPGADVMLGSEISDKSLLDPTIDSQNRFYGAAFSLYGIVLLLASAKPVFYRSLFLWTLLVFFLAGVARLVSVFATGWPPFLVVILLVVELILPPLLTLWYVRLYPRAEPAEA